MISLKRDEVIEVYQVELALEVKTKQSPFIAILILAQEKQEITASSLQENLLTSLPIRACENLLKRLEQQGYLRYGQEDMFGEVSYLLTAIGELSATDKSFWIGEKGAYNVYVSKSNFIEQDIIFIEKGRIEIVDQKMQENGKLNVMSIRTPQFSGTEYTIFVRDTFYDEQKRAILSKIEEAEIHLDSIEESCFLLKSENCILQIQSNGNESVLKLSKGSELLFQRNLNITESSLQLHLLSECYEFEFEQEKNAIPTNFDPYNLSFTRKVMLRKSFFHGNHFNQVELENIFHIPYDKENADMWYWELLFQNMTEYFPDEKSFNEFATNLAKLFLPHFDLTIPTRKEMAFILEERSDSFYQIAKLDTIDYLNYF